MPCECSALCCGPWRTSSAPDRAFRSSALAIVRAHFADRQATVTWSTRPSMKNDSAGLSLPSMRAMSACSMQSGEAT